MAITEEHLTPAEKIQLKVRIFFEKNWPAIYRMINNTLDGILQFIKDTVSSIWR